MGWVILSERELNRIDVLSQIDDGRLSVGNVANMLGLTERQTFRLLKRYRVEGASEIRHRARGRAPTNKIHDARRGYALALVKEKYADFGPTLAAEMLQEHHSFKVSRETLRKWLIDDGHWLSRKQRRTFHQPRRRRECYGELVQIDGSEHRWFEDRAEPCTLLVFIDDATSTLMELRFVKSESTFSHFEALESYLLKHGRPVAFYSDKHTVFRVPKPNQHMTGMTQFGRALSELNVEILCANSNQAKGRVERANRTLKDGLVKELRLNGISDMDAGNTILAGFMERYNFKFARVARKPDNLHRPLNAEPDRLADLLCWRDKRCFSRQLTFIYERRRYMLEDTNLTRGLVSEHIDTYAFPDGRFEARWKDISLPYSVFDRDQQHVTHAAVTENKRLGEVLSWIKDQQDGASPPAPKVKTNSERVGYKPNGKKRGRSTPSWKQTPERAARFKAMQEKKAAKEASP